VGTLTRQAALRRLQPELAAYMTFGRGLDTSRMRSVLGFEPAHTTAEAFAHFAASVPTRRTRQRSGRGRPPLATSTGGDHG
jgi:UDP-glucose 4-epimerase